MTGFVLPPALLQLAEELAAVLGGLTIAVVDGMPFRGRALMSSPALIEVEPNPSLMLLCHELGHLLDHIAGTNSHRTVLEREMAADAFAAAILTSPSPSLRELLMRTPPARSVAVDRTVDLIAVRWWMYAP